MALTASTLKRSDCVVVLTNHSPVDYGLVLRHAAIIVDTRNQYAGVRRRTRPIIRW